RRVSVVAPHPSLGHVAARVGAARDADAPGGRLQPPRRGGWHSRSLLSHVEESRRYAATVARLLHAPARVAQFRAPQPVFADRPPPDLRYARALGVLWRGHQPVQPAELSAAPAA